MRLLDVHTLKLHTFYGDAIPAYAILSHNWLQDHEEVTFQQIQNPEACAGMRGFQKVMFLCNQAIADGYKYAWIDTCCIDKSNSSELSEAINSMFAWYQDAAVCYAYLMDIDRNIDDLLTSRWWSRAWTLQELLAPRALGFFDSNWQSIGTKSDPEIAKSISDVIGIQADVLQDPSYMFQHSIARRMSWAAKRQATRAEDIAYALLGLFKINMPMQYGEGAAAFVRLQKEIMKTTNDQSLFAWGYSHDIYEGAKVNRSYNKYYSEYGMFAAHPNRFANCKNLIFLDKYCSSTAFTEANGAVHMDMPLLTLKSHSETDDERDCIGFLPCTDLDNQGVLIGILLKGWASNNSFIRRGFSDDGFTFRVKPKLAAEATVEKICISNSAPWWLVKRGLQPAVGWQRTIVVHFNMPGEVLRLISSPVSTSWTSEDMTLHVPWWTVRPEMRFEVASQHGKSTLWFKVCHDIIPSLHEEPRDHVIVVNLQDNEDTGRKVGGSELRLTGSEAALLRPDAKVEVDTESHIVFNHIITDLEITVRRFV